MKERLRKYKVNNIKKKVISLSTAAVMLMGDIPASGISSLIGKVTSLFSTTASADVTYYNRTEYTKTYLDTGYIHIESWADFVWYSQSYFNYTYGKYTTTIEHEKDVLYINIKDSIANNYDLSGKDYVPIGNDTKPFEGRLIFTNTSADTFNVPQALFGTVSEKVTIKKEDSTVKPITLTRTGTGNGDALFAQKVLSDNSPTTHSDWNIVLDKFDNSSAISYAGLIGEIDSSANVELTYANNALSGKSDILATASDYSGGKPADAGALCGKMGAGATLNATYSGSNTNYNITSNNGNAGGLVGSMELNSVLTVTASNLQGASAWVSASKGYAGGIVGKNDGGTVSVTPSSGTSYAVSQIIHGKNGTGGLFGYYSPPSEASPALDISNYSVNCKLEQAVSETGFAGGIIGVVENVPTTPAGRNGGSLTISGASNGTTVVISAHVTQTDSVTGNATGYKAEAYGGLIGSYKASDTSYSSNIKDIAVTPTNTLATSAYGGGIGKIIEASYVKFETFKLNSAAGDRTGTFGGLVADCPNGYVYADGSTTNTNCTGIEIGNSTIDGFKGGGLVGNLGDGVLGMKGTINLTYAKPTASDENGIIVGKRDNALIYADGSWTYTPNSAEVDNIGSWGDVLIIDGTKLKKDTVSDSLNVFSESDHIITIDSVNTSSIANAADYAKASLRFQIDSTKNSFITNYIKLADNTNLTFTDNIVLTGTGLRGITRDNGTDKITYSGTVSGGHTITLDIKNVGGSNRPVYRKKYIGMFGIADAVTINNTTFNGSILSKNERTTDKDTDCYLGSACAQIKTRFTASNCNTASGLNINMTGGVSTIAGRLIGQATGSVGNITISGSNYDGTITGNDKSVVGGVIGKIAGATSGAVWSFNGITLKGHITGIQQVGGLISNVVGEGNATIKLGNTAGVVADNDLIVEGNSSDSMGGLLGYSWSKADVEVTDVVVSGHPTVEQKSSGGAAGLVYRATGHWTVTKLYLGYTDAEENAHAIKMLTGTAGSVGMIVNKGKNDKDGIYLELPAEYDYRLAYYTAETGGSAFKSGGVFDEICAYSADSASNIMTNGQGIVSISTSGLVMGKSNTAAEGEPESLNYTDSLSYKNQTVQGKYKNGNTRYYYNLDTIDKDNTLSDDAKKLMRWGVRQYACDNIQKYFPEPFSNNTIPVGTYNMQGYSWYPVTPVNAMTVNGTFTFYNEEFDECEKVKGKHANISSNDDKNIWSPLESDQHYMMQNGLFYNVTQNLTIGAITLKGTIGAINNTHGTGALVYGTISGTADANGTTIISSSGGNISLDGVKIWNLNTYSSYAPLLINQASDYVTLNIEEVSTTSSYRTSDTTTPAAATSLIGKAGTRDTATEEKPISQGISVTFKNIKLDGRNAENNNVYDKDRYNTTKSIFTNATLLEQLIGSAGTYNFDYDTDWGTGTPHKVTYGRELGYTTAGQYPNQELWYENEKATGGKQRYVRPDSAPLASGSSQYSEFTDLSPYYFLPYVANVSTKDQIKAKTGFKYQLMVNHQPSDRINGCGTYNDPYIISSATDLVTISKFINSNSNLSGKINVDYDEDCWCDETDTDHLKNEHIEYELGSSTCTTTDTSKNKDAVKMRKYLASAYYQINLSGSTTIELSSDSGFLGLGTKDMPFCGVIDGGTGVKNITNKTTYPLINYSNGSVVRNISIKVQPGSDISLPMGNNTCAVNDDNNYKSFGGVIAKVMGGDNILDNVSVDYSLMTNKFLLANKYSQLVPIGGYIGVIYQGGVIFRNMSSAANNISDDLINVTSSDCKKNTSTELFLTNKAWLYINPYIGRVINGFAVYETDVYRPYETGTRSFGDDSTDTDSNGHVTLRNGTKHYSITDIKKYSLLNDSDKLGVTSGYAITIPDAQSFFLMSLMVSCGMSTYSGLGYYSSSVNSTNQISRSAEYNNIGSEAVTSSACDDYYQNAKNDGNSSNAYLIQKYTTSSSAANAKKMANQKDATITLSNKTYILPDGFKGIGNLFNNNDNYRLKITEFDGLGAIISQNTRYLYYQTDCDNKYYPVSTENVNGLGLFNNQPQGGSYSYFTLKGNVNSDIINWKSNSGTRVLYSIGNWSQSAGSLFGTSSGNLVLDSVALVNVDVHAPKITGGLLGYTSSGDITITNENHPLDSDRIKVRSGTTAGGVIGRDHVGIISLDFNNRTYNITEVISDCNASLTKDAYYNYGVGGLVGVARGNKNTTIGKSVSPLSVKDVKIGSELQTKLTYVKCENSDIYTGGLFGCLNRICADIEDCEIHNLSVEAQFAAGGLVGHWATSGGTTNTNYTTLLESKIINTSLNCNLDGAKIHSTGNTTLSDRIKYCAAGGLFGSCKCDMANVYVENCTVKNYDIYGVTYAGGVVGSWGDSSTSNTVDVDKKGADHIIQLNNVEVSGCNITSDTSSGFAGGLAGHLDEGYSGYQTEKYDLYGYNILAKNLSFSASKTGYICGENEAPERDMIKLVAFSRQNTDDSKVMIQDTVGDGGYGDYGYVVFADYNGTASYTENKDGTKTPGANSSDVFSNMTSSTNVTPAAPFVTTSPVLNIANKNSVMQYLLSDGASPLTTATVGRSTEAFANIYADIANTNAGYYSLPASYLDTAEEYSAYTNKISSFKTEMGTNKNLANGIDFPVLVLDNINKSQMTEFINKYISLLTNTTTSSVSGGKYNFAENASGVYSVVLKRVTFNSAGTAISEISDSSICLKKDNGQFYIEANDTDTKATTAQFTLIDVQFYDPSATTTVAYHLYIPCYVRKLVEYDFDIHVDSGTSYDIHSYDSLVENSLVENIGTPITLEFAFTYNRTADEWTVAANSGDSLLSNFSKDLLFDNATAVSSGTKPNFPTTTRMVLIDTQNSSKSYYLDGLSDTSFVPDGNYRNLKLDQFTSLDSQSFAPVDLNEMLDVTVTAADDGTLVADNNNATVKDTHTNTKYRLATYAESTNGNITKYSATVSFKNGATKLSEHYFLTIYTPYSETDVVYHYAIQANKSLGTTPYPSRITAESETHAVNLYVGYIYNNNVFIDSLKVNDTENEVVITKENNSIEASIHATIGLTSSGEANIRPTLSGDSPPDIYQSFLIKLNKDGDIGLAAVDSVTVSDYTIGGKSVTHRDLNPSWNSSDYTDIEIPNYIQLRNGVPLANALSQVAENQTLTISAKATLEFSYDKGDITKQFFPQTSNKRTTFVAYSNIASSSSQTASSKVSAMKDEKTDGTKPQYYTLIEEKATLNYDALEIASEGYLPQLGINANDPDDKKKLPSTIKTVGSYNVENCTSAWENANYLKIEIELKSKADNYVAALDIFDYLQESSFKIFDGEFTASTDTTSKKLVYIINKNALNSYYKDKVYQIPIEFKVYSGGGSANNFESQSRQYSNYGVFLKVSMLKASDSVTAVSGTEPEYNNNYVKYTNARIYLDKVNPNKPAS